MEIMFPDDLKEFVNSHAEGTYTLLDVRQPGEYEESHLPGAKLIPLPELGSSLAQLDREKVIIVYCAMGGRSRTAAQFLQHRGFRSVRILEGGLDAWEEGVASGPVEFAVKFLKGDEGTEEIVLMACRMEEGLRRFHLSILEKADEPEFANLVGRLVKAEESHERTLLSMLSSERAREEILRELGGEREQGAIEGGLGLREYLQKNDRFLKSIEGYIELAMMIEIQALDLYLHLGDLSRNAASREVFFRIGDEEKLHLEMLGAYLDSFHEKR
ncbi:MAG: rhodanese-like domain-containing protein [Syntrophobacteraceae bacterium]|nr:hypothetical protein [Desulfobacteraceae bacterium]